VIVGVCRLTVLVTYAHSLKEKRGAVRKLKDRVRSKFGVEIAEVGGLDTWQRAVLGFAVVSNERDHVESMLDKVIRFVEGLGAGELVSDDRDVLVYGDEF
jgi:uncharacterized protein